MATASNRGGGRCLCGPAEDPGRQMSLDRRELSGQCVTEQSAVSCRVRRCSARAQKQKGPPQPPYPIPPCFNGLGMSEFHLLMFLIHQFWCLCPFLATPNILKHTIQQTEVPPPVFLAKVTQPASPKLETLHPSSLWYLCSGMVITLLQPQLLTLKEG